MNRMANIFIIISSEDDWMADTFIILSSEDEWMADGSPKSRKVLVLWVEWGQQPTSSQGGTVVTCHKEGVIYSLTCLQGMEED